MSALAIFALSSMCFVVGMIVGFYLPIPKFEYERWKKESGLQ
jgi:hypothetical protein